MAVAQWNPCSFYKVNDTVSYAGVNYLATAANTNTQPPAACWSSETTGLLPAGLAKGLTWTAGGGGYQATITGVSTNLTATSCITATIQAGTASDVINSWLAVATPSATANGTITFVVAASPGTPSSFTISWVVNKY